VIIDRWTPGNESERHVKPPYSVFWNPRLRVYESHDPVRESGQSLSTFTQTAMVCAVIWSLCELPFELPFSRTFLEGAACITVKLIWLSLGIWALSGAKLAGSLFAFCCAASAMAIAFGFVDERRFSTVGLCLSAIECGLKVAAFICLVLSSRRRAVD
jgi:hypothetical protein